MTTTLRRIELPETVPARRRTTLEPARRTPLPPRPRPGRTPWAVAVGIVIVALFALAVVHTLLIVGQLELDRLQRSVAAEHEQLQVVRADVARLESPARVLERAREAGLVAPDEIGYLRPGEVLAPDDRIAVAPAEAEPDDEESGAAGAAPVVGGTPADESAEATPEASPTTAAETQETPSTSEVPPTTATEGSEPTEPTEPSEPSETSETSEPAATEDEG